MIFITRLIHGAAGAAALDAFLKPHTAAAFRLRSNVAKAGLVYHGNPYEAEYLGAFNGDRLIGVVGYSWMHTLLLCIEELDCILNYPPKFGPVNKVQIMVGKSDDDEDSEGIRERI